MYFIYIRFQESIYLITPAVEGEGFPEEVARKIVDTLVDEPAFGGDVTHEPSGDTFYLGIPAAAMKDVMFFAKEKKAE
jgi:hypothetical protein